MGGDTSLGGLDVESQQAATVLKPGQIKNLPFGDDLLPGDPDIGQPKYIGPHEQSSRQPQHPHSNTKKHQEQNNVFDPPLPLPRPLAAANLAPAAGMEPAWSACVAECPAAYRSRWTFWPLVGIGTVPGGVYKSPSALNSPA
jgi:hypothetical protein